MSLVRSNNPFRPLPPLLFSFEILLLECAVVVVVFIMLITVGYAGRAINDETWKLGGDQASGTVYFNFTPAMNGYTALVIKNVDDGNIAFNSGVFSAGTTTYSWIGTIGNYKGVIVYGSQEVSNYVKFTIE